MRPCFSITFIRSLTLVVELKPERIHVEGLEVTMCLFLSPFREMGQVAGVIPRFGNAEQLQEAVREMQWRWHGPAARALYRVQYGARRWY